MTPAESTKITLDGSGVPPRQKASKALLVASRATIRYPLLAIVVPAGSV